MPEGEEERPGGPGDQGLIAFLPSQASTLFPTAVGAATSVDKNRRDLTSDQLSILANSGLSERATDVDLGGNHGRYRVIATYLTLRPVNAPRSAGTPGVVIVGLPTTYNDSTVQRMWLFAVATAGSGIVLVSVLGTPFRPAQRAMPPPLLIAPPAIQTSSVSA